MRYLSKIIIATVVLLILASPICAQNRWFVSSSFDIDSYELVFSGAHDLNYMFSLGIGKEIYAKTRFSVFGLYGNSTRFGGKNETSGIGLRTQREIGKWRQNTSLFVGFNLMYLSVDHKYYPTYDVAYNDEVAGGDISIDEASDVYVFRKDRGFQHGFDMGFEHSLSSDVCLQFSSGFSFTSVKQVKDDVIHGRPYMELDVGEGVISPNNAFPISNKQWFWSMRFGLVYHL
ncbi:MAG: hypothetical protein KAR42_09355 [candidate division Zixibacteria bacterium]|nr:hypothetical protein [candidate division Zixibacteria bacterium]